MSKCSLCGRNEDTLVFGNDGDQLCESCKKAQDEKKCRRCGKPISPEVSIKGLCMDCLQVDSYEKAKKRDDMLVGLDNGFKQAKRRKFNQDEKITEEEFDRMMSYSPTGISSKDFKRDRMARRLWLIVKLLDFGVYDDATVNDNIEDLEYLVEAHVDELLKKRTKIVIVNSKKAREEVKKSTIICSKNNSYILEGDFAPDWDSK